MSKLTATILLVCALSFNAFAGEIPGVPVVPPCTQNCTQSTTAPATVSVTIEILLSVLRLRA